MARKRRDGYWCARRNGIFYAFWYDEAKRRTNRESLHTQDREVAKQRFARFLVEGTKATRAIGDAGVTVEQGLDWYDREHVEPNVVDKDRQRDVIAHLKTHFHDTPFKEVDVFASRAYAEARRRGDVGGGSRRKSKIGSDSTIRRELNVLVAAANHAVRFHKMPKDHLPTVELPVEVKRSRAPWLSKASMRRVLEKAHGPLRDFCLLAYYWGARRRSIERLLKSQVDLQHGRVDLNPPGAKLTKKRKPIVPIYPEIRSTVERLMDASETEYLFGAPHDFYREFVALCVEHDIKAEGTGSDPWPHLLRHSRATHMLMDGEDPYKVAKLLGDTLATVERVYGHADVEYLNTTSTIAEVA